MPRGYVISRLQRARERELPRRVIHNLREASARLLVLLYRAIPEPRSAEWAECTGLAHLFYPHVCRRSADKTKPIIYNEKNF